MTSPSPWYRLCVDVDLAGNPIGSSLEVHDGERVTTILVAPAPGPFDAAVEVFHDLADEVMARFGRHDELDLGVRL